VANSFYVDASALSKRYVPENGSVLVDVILDTVPASRICVLNMGMGEVMSILVRKRNAGLISVTEFAQAAADFKAEIVSVKAITKVPVTTRLVISSFPLIATHSINSNDALILKSALAVARRRRASGDDLVLVGSDQRLLRGAQAEGLGTFDPESQDKAGLAALVGP
jgi:predicted nucleic acid-binding protein